MTEKLKVYVSRLDGIYPDYTTALAACDTPVYAEGDVRTDERAYFKLRRKAWLGSKKPPNATVLARLSPYVQAAQRAGGKNLRFLDVGGTDGRFYFWLRRILGDDAIAAYDVLEAPQVAELGKRVAKPPMAFYGDISEVPEGHYDVVVFGAMLQIMPDPEAFMDSVLARVTWNHVVITVFPLRDAEDDLISSKRPTGAHGTPYRLFGRRWLEKFMGLGDMTHFKMPTYLYAFEGRKHPQYGVIISRGDEPNIEASTPTAFDNWLASGARGPLTA